MDSRREAGGALVQGTEPGARLAALSPSLSSCVPQFLYLSNGGNDSVCLLGWL